MKIKRGEFIRICLILGGSVIISWILFSKQIIQDDTVHVADFPKSIGTWSSIDLTIPKDDLAILETDNAFARKYTNSLDKRDVYLYIVYSQSNRKVSHPPEICYTGSGLTVTHTARDSIQVGVKNLTIPANRLKLIKGDFEHMSFYWFKVGDQFTANYLKQQALIALNTLIGRKSSTALIRISADIVNGEEGKTIESIKAFTNVIAPDLFSYLP